ncbi:hypothetical protein BDF22DRAFT_618103, partial [Syncephalis plumigaleata]
MASQPGTHGSSTSADSERVLAVKSSLSGIGWKKERRGVLRDFVNIVHTTTFHAYSFAKHILLKELDKPNFRFEKYISVGFFTEVWLALIQRETKHTEGTTAEFRAVIYSHLDDYLRIARYQPLVLLYAQQSA